MDIQILLYLKIEKCSEYENYSWLTSETFTYLSQNTVLCDILNDIYVGNYKYISNEYFAVLFLSYLDY